MIGKKYSSAAIAFAAIVPGGTAFADSGWYVHGGINSTTLEQQTTRNTGSNEPNVGPAGGTSASTVDQDTGASVYIAGGYEFKPFEDAFAAVEVYFADENAETQNINNVKVTDLSLNSSYGIDLKLGHNVTDKFAVYGLVGVAQYDFDGTVTYTFAPPIDDISAEEAAFVYGGGVEIGFNDKWSTIAEVRLSNDIDLSTPVDRGAIQSRDDLEFTVIRTGLKYKF